MFNLLRMDLRRLLRSKGLYICLGILSVIAIVSYFLIYIFANPNLLAYAIENDWAMVREMSVDMLKEEFGNMSLNALYHSNNISGGILVTTTAIVLTLFVGIDFKGGFIKNILSSHENKWDYILSKTITMGILNLVNILVTYLIYVMLNAVSGNYYIYNSAMDILLYILTTWMICNGLSALILLICIVTRSEGAGIGASIVICSGLVVVVLNSLLSLFDLNGLIQYTLFGNLIAIPSTFSGLEDYYGLLIGVIFTIIYVVFSKVVLTKKDI